MASGRRPSRGTSKAGRQVSAALRPTSVAPTAVSVLSTSTGARLDLIGGAESATEVTGVTLRAQEVRSGDLFAALPGSTTHGARFAADAVAAGATAILTDPAGRAELSRVLPPEASVVALVHPEPRTVLGGVSARIYGNPSQRLKLIALIGGSVVVKITSRITTVTPVGRQSRAKVRTSSTTSRASRSNQ